MSSRARTHDTSGKPARGSRRAGRMKALSRFGVHPDALAYSMTTLGAGMMNSIFSFYYVKLFLNKYKISEAAFHQSQVIYMIWNAVNDPLFGYLQDNSSVPCCSRRRLAILYGAPFYALSFLLAWFPWRAYAAGDWLSGVHLLVALCAFDGMLTFVLLSQCALFAEMSSEHHSRLKLIKYSQVASLVGSSSVLVCGLASGNMDDFPAFQAVTVLVALLACGCMLYTGLHSQSRYEARQGSKAEQEAPQGSSSSPPGLSLTSICSMTWQILTQRDFQRFVTMNFFQVFMVAFCNNFTMIFTEHLVPRDALPPLAKSLMYGAGFICPQMVVLGSQRLLRTVGYYRLILLTFYLEVGAAGVMLLLGPQHYYILALFLTTNISPLSSMVFGTNALFTKPAQSLAPMLIVNTLNQFGYETLKDVGAAADLSSLQALHSTMFYLVCLVPMCVAAMQIAAWTPFSIRDSHTVDAKYIET